MYRILYSTLNQNSHTVAEDIDGAVGFSAYASVNREYSYGNLVLFDRAFSNFGGYYQVDNSIFICPFDGVYVISLALMSAQSKVMSAGVHIDSDSYIRPYADNIDGVYGHASAMFVEYCAAGSQVWARARYDSEMEGSQYSYFSAFLLHRI